MAHVQKFNRASAGKILGHCEREKSQYGDFLKYKTTSNIDPDRTKLNMSMDFKDGQTVHQRLANRLAEVHVLNRKDVNVLCDWVITYPKELSQEKSEITQFFDSAIRFLAERYGVKNMISVNIHMDEAQPHVHFCFVPVVYDAKKKREKVSAKEVLSKKDLSTFHQDLERYMYQDIQLQSGLIHSGITKRQGGNRSIPELKAITQKKKSLEIQAVELKEDIQSYTMEKEELHEQCMELCRKEYHLRTKGIPDAKKILEQEKNEYQKWNALVETKKQEVALLNKELVELEEANSEQVKKYKTNKSVLERMAKDIDNLPGFMEEYGMKLGYQTRKALGTHIPIYSNNVNESAKKKKRGYSR